MIANKIQIITENQLTHETLCQLYSALKSNFTANLLTTILVTKENSGDTAAVMCCVKQNDKFVYMFPISRALVSSELANLAYIISNVIDADFELTATETGFDEIPVQSVEIPKSQYDELCGEWAKNQHNEWMNARIADGWRYGPSVDIDAKTHPLLRPWHELPPEHQKVDEKQPKSLFNMLDKMGFSVVLKDDIKKIQRLLSEN